MINVTKSWCSYEVGTQETGLHTVLKASGGPIPVVNHFVGKLMGSL